jgi:hypothetical protein
VSRSRARVASTSPCGKGGSSAVRRHSRTLAHPSGLGLGLLLGEACAVASDECERDGQVESEEAEEAELEKEVGECAPGCGRPFELCRDDEDAPHHCDESNDQERLDDDLVRAEDEAECVDELGDDQGEQNAVEYCHCRGDGAGSGGDSVCEFVHGSSQDEDRCGREQEADRGLKELLEADEPAEQEARPPRLCGG